MKTVSWILLLAGLAAGRLADRPASRPPLSMGGYRVLAADFHLHPFPLSSSTLTPWDLMWDAQREGLDTVAIAGQNEAWSGQIARWVSLHWGGPIVIASQEIHGPVFHLIAAGIHSTISWRLSAAQAIEEIHRQGGVAIAAHPTASAWRAFDARAMDLLDAAEVWQPVVFIGGKYASDLREFYARKPVAAIGSSDWHGLGAPGLCRTWVFVREGTEGEVLQAIRERRTVVFDGREYFGDAGLIAMFREHPPQPPSPPSPWQQVSRLCALAGILSLIYRFFLLRNSTMS